MLKKITLILSLLLTSVGLHADNSQEVLPDSSNFVTASLLTTSPTDIIYSTMGHSAIRMECPSESLDYCFSLEMAALPGDYARFFSGKMKAAVVAIPTPEFIKAYRGEGRGIMQRELNLTPHEKQKLWRLLDEEVVKAPHLTFNFLNTNCVMMSIMMIEQCLIDEQIDFGQLPAALQLNNGDLIRHHSENAPWAQFLFITLSGAACDGHKAMEYRLSPTMLVEVLQQSTIRGDSIPARPVFKGAAQELFPATVIPHPSPITPTRLFGLLLLVTLALTLASRLGKLQTATHILDILLFVFQTAVGLFLLYFSTVANLFGSHWNWYLIPFCPLAAILWLLFHHRPWHRHLYLLYTIVLILMILATPISSQLDLPHQLITAIFAVRTFDNYLRNRPKG